jgi:hypothetical protein
VVDFVLIELGCAELGVAWQVANLPAPPAMFTVRSRNRMPEEASRARLRVLGLIDPRGALSADLRQAMSVFAHARAEVDLRFAARRGTEVRAAVTAEDGVAMLAVITGGHVRFSRLPEEAALAALVSVLPSTEPAKGTLVSLPVAEVDAAITTSMERGLDCDDGVVHGLTARGVSGADARLFVSLVGTRRLRIAEFGVTIRGRSGARHRCSRTVQVVDTRRGRSVLYTRGDYLVAAPADRDTVVSALGELRDAEPGRLDDNRLG